MGKKWVTSGSGKNLILYLEQTTLETRIMDEKDPFASELNLSFSLGVQCSNCVSQFAELTTQQIHMDLSCCRGNISYAHNVGNMVHSMKQNHGFIVLFLVMVFHNLQGIHMDCLLIFSRFQIISLPHCQWSSPEGYRLNLLEMQRNSSHHETD